MRILIAEDDPTSRLLLETVLTRKGYEVTAACDGLEAWQYLQDANAPNLAILDWMMPGMDGSEICRRLRAEQRSVQIYVILLTAKSAKDEIVAGLQSGANDYITKPFVREELLARVHVGVQMVTLQQNLADRVKELEDALTMVKQLEGMLPICANCKNIRDDSGGWNRIEDYVSEHTQAVFSHGNLPFVRPATLSRRIRAHHFKKSPDFLKFRVQTLACPIFVKSGLKMVIRRVLSCMGVCAMTPMTLALTLMLSLLKCHFQRNDTWLESMTLSHL